MKDKHKTKMYVFHLLLVGWGPSRVGRCGHIWFGVLI